MAQNKKSKDVDNFKHDDKRLHIPTAEYHSLLHEEERSSIQVAYERRNRDLDPQLVWRGKDVQDWSDLVVQAPPLYIQEKIHPRVLIDDLRRQTEEQEQEGLLQQLDFFADFNGLPSPAAKTEFYQHDANWSNRMILGDSLQVMASLAEREGLRGKVQCIYIDPPYGIKFNSNFQWSTTSRDVKDGKLDHITREPEQVKAFRDTWRDGIHSYLTYLRDRLTVAHDLLTDNGSIFVQIGDENVHLVRVILDEIFSSDNFVAQITFRVKSPLGVSDLARTTDFIIWYAKSRQKLKFRQARNPKELDEHPEFSKTLFPDGRVVSARKIKNSKVRNEVRYFTAQNLASSGYTPSCTFPFTIDGRTFSNPKGKSWKTNLEGMNRLYYAGRLQPLETSLRWRYFFDDATSEVITDVWMDTFAASNKNYVVETSDAVIQRCILMTTDPGDLVLDPTCGSGTTAYVAEKWGRRWITVDTSRVALALARARLMGARFPYFLLVDSKDGKEKEAQLSRTVPSIEQTFDDIRHGFVYKRVPHITLKSIAHNNEIDVIWKNYQEHLEALRTSLNQQLGENWEGWEIPRELNDNSSNEAKILHSQWWDLRIERQQQIDASIAASAEYEYLYDQPYEDNSKVRVSGPFTVESLSPHRILGVDENDELIDPREDGAGLKESHSFVQIILENLKTAGVQQAHKEDKINFSTLSPWPGANICAEGRYFEGENEHAVEKRAGIFIGPEFGTVSRPDLVEAAREAGDAGFDVLIACAFNYDARSTEFDRLGAIPVLKARMNADLHMANDLKNTGKGNLFVIFGEPDIDLLELEDQQIQVKINGVDVFHPNTGEIRSHGAEGIACWFIDTNYDEESFFVRHAYFLGANDPYSSLKTTLKAEINKEAWETLYSDTSRPFDKPKTGRIAVKVINHLGDEVMKVFKVN
ncbi:MAG: site-specific DNA-methyltransferase [Aggregatilineales bacterium]